MAFPLGGQASIEFEMNGTTVVYANGGAKVDTEACGDEISQVCNTSDDGAF